MWIVTGQACDRGKTKGLHCWHQKTIPKAFGEFDEICDTCCWCGAEVHYRKPSLEGHGPFLKKETQ